MATKTTPRGLLNVEEYDELWRLITRVRETSWEAGSVFGAGDAAASREARNADSQAYVELVQFMASLVKPDALAKVCARDRAEEARTDG